MLSGDVSLALLALLVITFVLSHVGLVVLARRFNVLLLLATAYLMLSPASGASELPGPLYQWAKLGRIYVTLLMLLLAFTVVRVSSIRPLSSLFLAFIAFFTASALWSDMPMDALKYKGLYALMVLAGLLIGNSVRSLDELHDGVRMFALAGLVFVAFIMFQVVTNPAAISRVGRLAAWGMNGNRIGQTAAPLLTICGYLALYDPKRLWKLLGYGTGVMLGIIIIYTGSRGAAVEALVGSFLVGIPLLRRPAVFVLVLVFFSGTAFLAFRYSGAEERATDRFFDPSLETREDPWTEGMRYFHQAPVGGNGWVTHEGEVGKPESTTNFHSMFMQVLVEAGLVGLTLFILVWAIIVVGAVRTLRRVRRMRSSTAIYLIAGLLFAILTHGFFEAGTLIGSLVDSLLLPFCIAMLGRLPALERARLRAISGGAVVTGEPTMMPARRTSAAGAWPLSSRTSRVE